MDWEAEGACVAAGCEADIVRSSSMTISLVWLLALYHTCISQRVCVASCRSPLRMGNNKTKKHAKAHHAKGKEVWHTVQSLRSKGVVVSESISLRSDPWRAKPVAFASVAIEVRCAQESINQ